MVESAPGKAGGGGGGGTNNVPFATLLDPYNDRKCKQADCPATKSLEHNTLFHQSGNIQI